MKKCPGDILEAPVVLPESVNFDFRSIKQLSRVSLWVSMQLAS